MTAAILAVALAGPALVMAAPATPAGANQVLTITNANLPPATAGQPYSVQLEASGGTAPYTFTLLTGAGNEPPPAGLTVSASGLVSGTPVQQMNQPLESTFRLAVTDSSNPQNSSVDGSSVVSITVSPPGYQPPPPLEITTTSLPEATLNEPYSATLQATGGTPPYTWWSNDLPQGLSISSSGTITGVSDIPQQTQVTIGVNDSGLDYDGPLGVSDEFQQTSEQFTLTVSSGVAQLDPTLFELQIPTLIGGADNLPQYVENELYDVLALLPGGGSTTGLIGYITMQENILLSEVESAICQAANGALNQFKNICGP